MKISIPSLLLEPAYFNFQVLHVNILKDIKRYLGNGLFAGMEASYVLIPIKKYQDQKILRLKNFTGKYLHLSCRYFC